jgi:hypothetical protein
MARRGAEFREFLAQENADLPEADVFPLSFKSLLPLAKKEE